MREIKTIKISDIMDIPKDYHYISKPKINITKAIKEQSDEMGLSIRKLGDKIGMKHPQIVRVTTCENYNIDTLLKILNGLDLELVVQKKND